VNLQQFWWTDCTTTAREPPWVWPSHRHRTRHLRSVRGSRQTQHRHRTRRHRTLSGRMRQRQRRSPNTRQRAATQDTRRLLRPRHRLTTTKPFRHPQLQPRHQLRHHSKHSTMGVVATLLHQQFQPLCRLLCQLPLRHRSRHSIMGAVPHRLGRQRVEWPHLPLPQVRLLSSSLVLHRLLLRHRHKHNRSSACQFQAAGSTCLKVLNSGRTSLRPTNRLGQRLGLGRESTSCLVQWLDRRGRREFRKPSRRRQWRLLTRRMYQHQFSR